MNPSVPNPDAGWRSESRARSGPPEPASDERAAFTAGLREVADWLDANPDVALPFPRLSIYAPGYSAGSAVAAAAVFAAATGQCTKGAEELGDRFTLTRMFGPVALIWSATRSAVCEKRTVTKTVEEWVCPESLLREADERAAAEGAA